MKSPSLAMAVITRLALLVTVALHPLGATGFAADPSVEVRDRLVGVFAGGNVNPEPGLQTDLSPYGLCSRKYERQHGGGDRPGELHDRNRFILRCLQERYRKEGCRQKPPSSDPLCAYLKDSLCEVEAAVGFGDCYLRVRPEDISICIINCFFHSSSVDCPLDELNPDTEHWVAHFCNGLLRAYEENFRLWCRNGGGMPC